jgi:hypothetical protein
MQREDKVKIIICASLVVIGITGLVIVDRLAEKVVKQHSEEYAERHMQLGWERIQNMKFFATATPEDRIKYFDAYWKTTGGVKPHTN